MKTVTLYVPDELATAIEHYTEWRLIDTEKGGRAGKDWEQARSYAVEVATQLLLANPQAFRYADDMQALMAKRKGTRT